MIHYLETKKGGIFLDGNEVRGVTDFKLEKSATHGYATLSLKMSVRSTLDQADEQGNQNQRKKQCSLGHRKRSYR